jgi:hypothetical protein
LTEAGLTVTTEDSTTIDLTEVNAASVTGTFTPDAWNHIIMTRGAVNLKLYIDNVLMDTDTGMDGVIQSNTTDLIIG